MQTNNMTLMNGQTLEYAIGKPASSKTQMQIKWKEILEFDNLFSQKEEELNMILEQGKKEKYHKWLQELAKLSTEFISTTFGRNVNRIYLTKIINYAKYRKSLKS